jgi:hypothetical protein
MTAFLWLALALTLLFVAVVIQLPPIERGPWWLGRLCEIHHGYLAILGVVLLGLAHPVSLLALTARFVLALLCVWIWFDDVTQHLVELLDKWRGKPIRRDYSLWHNFEGFVRLHWPGASR